MYLVSIYFDEKTNRKIQKYIDQMAAKTGNTFMIDGNVPPHLTISAFETKQEENCIDKGYVYIDAVNCIHTKRACEGFGKTMNLFKGGEIKIPFLEYIKIDSLENYNKDKLGNRESYLYGDKYVIGF